MHDVQEKDKEEVDFVIEGRSQGAGEGSEGVGARRHTPD